MFGIDDMAMATGFSALANLGGGLFSSAGQASANAENVRMQNQMNQQMLNAQMAQHAQNTGFMEDAQAHDIEMLGLNQKFNSAEAETNRLFNSREAYANRAFQYDLATSAYQRAMADMKKAGLNPILAYQQGGGPMAGGAQGAGSPASSSGGGSSMAHAAGPPNLHAPTVQNEKDAIGRAIGNAVSSAVDTYKTAAGVEVIKEEEKLKREQTETERKRQSQIDAETRRTREEEERTRVDTQNKRDENAIIRAQGTSAYHQSRAAGGEADNMDRYGRRDAPDTRERIMRTIQRVIEGNYLPEIKQGDPGFILPPAPSSPKANDSDFWGTSDKIRQRAEENRRKYGN